MLIKTASNSKISTDQNIEISQQIGEKSENRRQCELKTKENKPII